MESKDPFRGRLVGRKIVPPPADWLSGYRWAKAGPRQEAGTHATPAGRAVMPSQSGYAGPVGSVARLSLFAFDRR
jgi:hypothetical protein